MTAPTTWRPESRTRRDPGNDEQLVRLEVLAARVAGLTPNWADPRQFYEERSEIAAGLRALARGIGR